MKIIVIGGGTIGRNIIKHIRKEKHNIIVIDNDKDIIENLIEKNDIMGIVGNGASIDILEEAGAKNADLVISVTASDEINILACAMAKKLGADNTIARVRKPEYLNQNHIIKDHFGIDMIINPELETAHDIMNMLKLPGVVKIEQFGKNKANLIELVAEQNSFIVGETLISLSQKMKTKFIVCAVQRGSEAIIPAGNFLIRKNDHLHVVVSASDTDAFLKELNLIKNPVQNVIIIGGSMIAYYVCDELGRKGPDIKVIESNPKRASELAQELPYATIICGDGTDHELLKEVGIDECDATVALTNIDEENLLVSMYANKIEVRKVITKLKRDSFVSLFDDLGVASIVSPKDIFANKIISYIRALTNKEGSNLVSMYRIANNKAEALEFIAKKKEKFYNRPLKELKFTENSLIACIIRDGKVIIPKGNDYILVNDYVVVVTLQDTFDDLNDIIK